MRGRAKLTLAGLVMIAMTAWPVAAWSQEVGVHICVPGLNLNVAPLDCPTTQPPAGSTTGQATPPRQSAPSASQPASGPPAFSRAVDAQPVRGTVRFKAPGAKRFVKLSGTSRLPTGSLIDTARGAVRVTSPRATDGSSQSAVFSGATFKVVQQSQARPTTAVNLTGGDFSICRTPARSLRVARAARKRKRVRRVRARGHGRFRTRGRYGSASVRGTIWVTEDRCDGTLVRVVRGEVAVRDFARQRTVLVRAGRSHLIRPRS